MIRFLTLAEILLICENQIRNYGGIYGVRDLSLISSAAAMPQSSYAGTYLHPSIPEMAAAYAFHLCKNHPFLDGNKRVPLAAALVFLDLNGYDFVCGNDEVYDTFMALASDTLSKDALSAFFIAHSSPR